MNLSDYLLDHDGWDWSSLLSGWSTILPPSFTVWLVNRLGEVILVVDDGSVHMLDVGQGTLVRLADNRHHFVEQLDLGDNANTWLLTPLVDKCVAAGMNLRQGQCYGHKIPPMFGGDYSLENIVAVNVAEYYSFLTDMYRRTKDLPDGTRA